MVGAVGRVDGRMPPQAKPTAERILLVGATLLDGNGGAPMVGARIVIENGRFTCVSGPAGCPGQAGDEVIDLTGQWITPGLIDTHVHLPLATAPDGLMRAQRLRFALGITTVRDAGSRATDLLLAARTEGEEAATPMPRLVVASRVEAVDAERLGVALGAPVVERLAALGVEAIKLKPPFDHEIWREEIRAARRVGIPVFGHTWASSTDEFTREAIAEGINGISHVMGLVLSVQPRGTTLTPPTDEDAFWQWEKGLWLTIDSTQVESLFDAMLAGNVWLEPTLASEYHFGRELLPPPQAGYLGVPPTLRQVISGRMPDPPRLPPVFPATWQRQAAFIHEFVRRGGMVVAGSDGLAPGIDLHEEIALIGEAAGNPMVGLQAATRNAAIALHRPDLGTVEVGKLADAVVYAADPLGARGASLLVGRVIKGGMLYDGDQLRAEFRAEYDARVRSAWRARAVRGAKFAGVILLAGLGAWWLLRASRRRAVAT